MARITNGIQFEGSIGNISAYKQKGSDKVILRTKGGASKLKISTSPRFAMVRRYNSEWGACSKMGMAIRHATIGLRHLSDFNISSPLNAITKAIQKTDANGILGERGIYLSLNRDMVLGFSFNKQLLLDSVLRFPVQITVDRVGKSAQITVPRIIPDVNLKQYGKNPLFRLVASLGVVSDFVFNTELNKYEPVNTALHGKSVTVYSVWHTVKEVVEEQQIMLSFPFDDVLTEHDSILIAFGVEFGYPLSEAFVMTAKNVGCAKIISVG